MSQSSTCQVTAASDSPGAALVDAVETPAQDTRAPSLSAENGRVAAEAPAWNQPPSQGFITELFDDALSAERRLAVFTVPSLQTRLFADAAGAAVYAKEQSPAQNVYFGVGLIQGSPSGRGKAKDVAAIGALWADIDLLGPGRDKKPLPATLDDAQGILERLPHAPSMLVHSGHGLHAYWVLKEPWVFDTDGERDQAARLAKGWHGTVCAAAESLGWHLENLGDLTRVLRLPGTLNHKGTPPAEVRVIESHLERRFNPGDFEPYLAETDDKAPVPTGENLVLRADAEPPAAKMAEAIAACPKFRQTWNHERTDLADQSQSGYDLALASIAARLDWTDQETADLLIAARRRTGASPEKSLRRDYMLRTLARAHQAAAEIPAEGADVDLSGILGQAAASADAGAGSAAPGVTVPGPRTGAIGQVCVADEAPEPFPLDDPEPPAMPPRLLDGWLGRMAEEIAEATETPLELPALLCLSAAATAAQGRFSVRPEPGYFEPVNLWTAPAMKSGQRKTAVHKLATGPLVDWERAERKRTADERQRAESKAKTLQARITRLRAKCAAEDDPQKRDELQKEIEGVEASVPRVPVPPRLFTQDVTPEHLGTMMAEQSGRMAILSDEGGIFDVLAGRYSNGIPNLDLFLQSHSGAPVRVDRGSRPPVVLDHTLLTMGLSPQPDVLKALSTKPGFRGRGLLARFLYALPKSRMGYRGLEPRRIPDDVALRYADGLLALLRVTLRYDAAAEMAYPHVLSLDGPAYGVWKDHQRRVEVQLRQGGRFAGMTDWAGKLPGAVARIAGLFHCVRWVLEPGNPVDRPIDADTMECAARLGELLAEHALAVFDLMDGGGALEAARRVWRHVQDRGLTDFTFSELWHPLRGTFRTTADIEPAIDVLLDHNLVLPVEERRPGKRGRRGRRFRTNPRALETATA